MAKRKRNILLVEPGYKNKYPPIGLMKIASYHRILGDNVTFYKGDIREFILTQLIDKCVHKLTDLYPKTNWCEKIEFIGKYIKTGQSKYIDLILPKSSDVNSELSRMIPVLAVWLKDFSDSYRKKQYVCLPKWDRIYITTLFTFHWKITIKTIQDAKNLVTNINNIKVGGVMATVLAGEVKEETGIAPHAGLLDKAGIFDNNRIIIDDMPLDYSILDEIEYKYPENDAYYGYMTRGCKRKCSFCAVKVIEPEFKHYVSLKNKIEETRKLYGDQRNLLLLDNNVLASDKFYEIIQEIKDCGFTKGAKFVSPNLLDIAVTNLGKSVNDKAYINKAYELLHYMLNRLKGEKQQLFYDLLDEYNLLSLQKTTKSNIIAVYPHVKEVFEKYRNKAQKLRYVDFNQGLDARLLIEDKIKALSEIPIRPMRIAFDSMKYAEIYKRAVHLAAKHGIKHLSNYLLYNEKDRPEELYQRLEINILLAEELKVSIYSFPMKFHPICGVQQSNRTFLGTHWNRKYVSAIQTILNATKGQIGTGVSYFYKAFGRNLDEFREILIMPETFILYRFFFEDMGYTQKWRVSLGRFGTKNRQKIIEVVEKNKFDDFDKSGLTHSVIKFIETYYLVSRSVIANPKSKYFKEKQAYDLLKQTNLK
ncbi:MAG: hypothetical protein PF904_20805 [Kiritimatiellae bacterium]|jgi:hypothetical protein|nr:hypothetical protein [Kiritimatiellia bacterium]